MFSFILTKMKLPFCWHRSIGLSVKHTISVYSSGTYRIFNVLDTSGIHNDLSEKQRPELPATVLNRIACRDSAAPHVARYQGIDFNDATVWT